MVMPSPSITYTRTLPLRSTHIHRYMLIYTFIDIHTCSTYIHGHTLTYIFIDTLTHI